jgi:hypothetical protein
LAQTLGAIAPQNCVRPPADSAEVVATFWLSMPVAAAARELLTGLGLPPRALPPANSPCTLLIRREVASLSCFQGLVAELTALHSMDACLTHM